MFACLLGMHDFSDEMIEGHLKCRECGVLVKVGGGEEESPLQSRWDAAFPFLVMGILLAAVLLFIFLRLPIP